MGCFGHESVCLCFAFGRVVPAVGCLFLELDNNFVITKEADEVGWNRQNVAACSAVPVHASSSHPRVS